MEKKNLKDQAEKWFTSIEVDNRKQNQLIQKLEKEVVSLKDHKCHSCGQDIHDEKQTSILRDKEEQLGEVRSHMLSNVDQQKEWQQAIDELGELGHMPVTHYNKLQEALEHQNKILNNLCITISGKLSNKNKIPICLSFCFTS